MAQLDFRLSQPRTPLDMGGGISTYFQAQQNKRANIATEATQTRTREAKAKATLQAQKVREFTDENGKFDSDGFIGWKMSTGDLKGAQEIRKEIDDQKASIFNLEKKKTEMQGKRIGQLVEGFKTAPQTPEAQDQAMQSLLSGLNKSGIKFNPILIDNEIGQAQLQEVERLWGVYGSNEGKKRLSGKKKDPFAKDKIDLEKRKINLSGKELDFKFKKLESDLKNLSKGGLTPEKKIEIERQLRGEFLKQNKDYAVVGDAYNRILVSAVNPSPAGDLALIFNYMKMLDPGSTVREGEFATAAASGSFGERFVAAGKKIVSGERLTDTMRGDFVDRSKKLIGSYKSGYEKSKRVYDKLSDDYGVKSSRVSIDIGREIKTTKSQKRKELRSKYGY